MPSLSYYHFGPPLMDSFHPVSSFTPCSHLPHILPIVTSPLFIHFSFTVIPPSFFILNSLITLSLSLNLNIFSPRSPPSLLVRTAYCLLPTPKASDLDCSVIFS